MAALMLGVVVVADWHGGDVGAVQEHRSRGVPG